MARLIFQMIQVLIAHGSFASFLYCIGRKVTEKSLHGSGHSEQVSNIHVWEAPDRADKNGSFSVVTSIMAGRDNWRMLSFCDAVISRKGSERSTAPLRIQHCKAVDQYLWPNGSCAADNLDCSNRRSQYRYSEV